jgi:large subunit ribosomal protein L21
VSILERLSIPPSAGPSDVRWRFETAFRKVLIMYAVISTGGKQYKVSEGETIRVEKITGEIGAPVSFDRVLMFSDGDTVKVGQPTLTDVTVTGHIVEQGKAKKIIVFKHKRRKRYRRKQGHRQLFTALKIDNIKIS